MPRRSWHGGMTGGFRPSEKDMGGVCIIGVPSRPGNVEEFEDIGVAQVAIYVSFGMSSSGEVGPVHSVQLS